jgi:hypothetical protein
MLSKNNFVEFERERERGEGLERSFFTAGLNSIEDCNNRPFLNPL